MATYTIHQPPLRDDEESSDPDRFVFVRDGFYFWALTFGPIWMLRHRLLLVLLLYVLFLGLVGIALWLVGANPVTFLIVHYLISLLVGIEAATLRRWTLARRGWKTLGVVVADELESAERRFFDAWVEHDEPTASPPPPPPQHSRRIPPPPDVIGLFPEPGGPR